MKLIFQILLLSVLPFSSCNTSTPAAKKSIGTSSPISTPTPVSAPPAQHATEGFATAVQGEWKRTTYPYGTITFKGDEVKIEVGEGTPYPPTFEKFRFSDSCPFNDTKANKSRYLDFLVQEDSKTCDAIRMVSDTLFLGEAEANSAVAYTHVAGGMRSKEFTIPKSVQGSWAVGKENCAIRNHNRITINARSIQFFERTAELTDVTEYEPTRIAGMFKTKEEAKPFRIVLDAQQGGQVLIIRQYAKSTSAAPAKYERCEDL